MTGTIWRNVSRRGLGCDWFFSAHRCALSYSYGNQSQRLIQRPRDLKTCTAPLDGALQTRGTPPRATQAHRRDHHHHGGPRGRGTRLDRALPAFPPPDARAKTGKMASVAMARAAAQGFFVFRLATAAKVERLSPRSTLPFRAMADDSLLLSSPNAAPERDRWISIPL